LSQLLSKVTVESCSPANVQCVRLVAVRRNLIMCCYRTRLKNTDISQGSVATH